MFYSQEYNSFKERLLINTKLLSPEAFDSQATQLANVFVRNTQLFFTRSLTQLREIVGISQPLPATSTLIYELLIRATFHRKQVQIEPSTFFSHCSCITDPTTCSKQAAFYEYNPLNDSHNPTFTVLGIRVACSSMESVFQSNLACWYSSTCYQTVRI